MIALKKITELINGIRLICTLFFDVLKFGSISGFYFMSSDSVLLLLLHCHDGSLHCFNYDVHVLYILFSCL